MTLNIGELFDTLNINQSEATQKEIKKAYLAMSLKFHPDRSGAGANAEIMKKVNDAYLKLKGLGDVVKNVYVYNGEEKTSKFTPDYTQKIYNVLQSLGALIRTKGVIVEIVGSWIWVYGETKAHKEELKAAKFRWSASRKKWYYNTKPSNTKFRRGSGKSFNEIREENGSHIFTQAASNKLQNSTERIQA